MRAQRRYPSLFSKLVVLDVVWTASKRPPQSLRTMGVLLALGLSYQYWAMACWIAAVGIPVIGRAIGDRMFELMLFLMRKALPKTSYANRKAPPTALMCYPYFYFHLEMVSEMLGLRNDHDLRVGATGPNIWEGGPPLLFIHGADKGRRRDSLIYCVIVIWYCSS